MMAAGERIGFQGPEGNLYFTSGGGEVTGLFKLSRTAGPNGSSPPVSPANSLPGKEAE